MMDGKIDFNSVIRVLKDYDGLVKSKEEHSIVLTEEMKEKWEEMLVKFNDKIIGRVIEPPKGSEIDMVKTYHVVMVEQVICTSNYLVENYFDLDVSYLLEQPINKEIWLKFREQNEYITIVDKYGEKRREQCYRFKPVYVNK